MKAAAEASRSDALPLDTIADAVVGPPLDAAPGAVVAASRIGAARRAGIGASGRLTRGGEPVSARTIYDLASVTKPLVALTFARLERAGVITRSEPLEAALPSVRGSASAAVTLDLLFAHRSGLEAHVQIYAGAERRFAEEGVVAAGRSVPLADAIATAANARRVDCVGAPPAGGFAPVYSDLGYLLAGAAMEARTGVALDALVDREVLSPLGLSGRIGSARQLLGAAGALARTAPTEVVPFRGGLVHGVVHDENAFVVSGDAICGHAGLFGDAASVRAVGEALLSVLDGRSEWLSRAELAPLVRERPGGSLLAGFDRRAGDAPSSGARLSVDTFGHLGFTGTSLWIDPRARFVGVLLTNRVHPSRDHVAIRRARPAAYDAMFDALSG